MLNRKNSYQVVHGRRNEDTVGNLEISPGGRQNQNVVAVNEFWEDSDGVIELCLGPHVLAGQVVSPDDLPAVSGPDRHSKVSQFCVLKAGNDSLESLEGEHSLSSSLHLRSGEVVHVRAVHSLHVGEVEVGGLPGVGEGRPGTPDVLGVLDWDGPAVPGLLELEVEVWTAERIFLA